VVKRIKKRIPKEETPELDPAAQVDAPENLDEQLDELAEDKFTQYTADVFKWVVRHRVAILGLLIGGAVLIAGASFVAHRREAGVEQASAAFQEAATAYGKAIEPAAPSLDPERPEAKADPQARQANLEKARTGFESVVKEHGDRPVSGLATIGLASVDYDLGKPGDALARYDEILGKADLDPFTKIVVMQAKAAALETAGKPDDAIKVWKDVEAADKAVYGLQARVATGRILEAGGDAAGARQTYQQAQKDLADVIDQAANRPYKAEIERRLARLGSDA
jgi:tetratricopeptide (TPR) repeat protein